MIWGQLARHFHWHALALGRNKCLWQDNGLHTAPIRRIGADKEGDKFGNEKDDGF